MARSAMDRDHRADTIVPKFVMLAPSIEKPHPFAIPSATSFAMPSYPPPRTPRSPRLEKLARAPHTNSDAAFAGMVASSMSTPLDRRPPHLVDDLTQIARSQLSTAEVARLRDNLTKLLEAASGSAATAAAAVRASRSYEAQLKASKRGPTTAAPTSTPSRLVSVRDLCESFCGWPPQVQRHFFRSVLSLGGFAHCMWDDEYAPPDSPLAARRPGTAAVDPMVMGERLQPLGMTFPVSAAPVAPVPPAVPPSTANAGGATTTSRALVLRRSGELRTPREAAARSKQQALCELAAASVARGCDATALLVPRLLLHAARSLLSRRTPLR